MKNPSRKAPELRFKGFFDDWEQRKLKELGSFIRKNINPQSFPNDIFIEYSMPSFDQGRLPKKVLGKKMKSNRLKITGDVLLINKLNIRQKRIWLVIDAPDNAVASSEFMPYAPEKIDLEFLNQLILTNKITNELESLSSGTSNSQKRITPTDFLNYKIIIPNNNKEQNKIGSFFEKLDTVITLHQRKLDALEQLKEAYLQNIFPQKGELVPKVRFANFTEKWEERKLEEVADIVGGGTPSTKVSEYWDGEIDWYSPKEIGNKMYVSGSERKITKLGLANSSTNILPANKTILFTSRAGIGNIAILKKKGTTNQGFQSLIINDNYNVYFIYYANDKIKKEAIRNASGSTFLEISGTELRKVKLFTPYLNEQVKIGLFMKQIDSIITFHKQKLIQFQDLKNTYLQKMFI